MEHPLSVFVNSVITGMTAERQATQAAIERIPLSRPWLFEFSPASALPLEESYLSRVRGCDIFVLLLSAAVTGPVKREVETAQAERKPLLVFLDAAAPPDVAAYARSLGVKYATYRDAAGLGRQVAEAVGNELITGYRRYRVPRADLTPIGDFLDGLAQGVVQISAGGVQVGRDQTVSGDLVLRDKIGRQINLPGGTYVEGDYVVNPEIAPPEDLLRAYYRAVAADCRRLPLGIIDKEFVRASQGAPASEGEQAMPLPDIYVDLDVIAPAEEHARNAARLGIALDAGRR